MSSVNHSLRTVVLELDYSTIFKFKVHISILIRIKLIYIEVFFYL